MNICINAPKLWIPVSAKTMDGAMFLDAGLIKMNILKKELTKDTTRDVDVSDIQVKFNGVMSEEGFSSYESSSKSNHSITKQESNERKAIHIILPFNVHMFSNIAETANIPKIRSLREDSNSSKRSDLVDYIENSQYFGYVNRVHVGIGKISLNLVDADVLAKAIGRWYAIGIAKRELYQNRNVKLATIQWPSTKSYGRNKKIGSSRGNSFNSSNHTENLC